MCFKGNHALKINQLMFLLKKGLFNNIRIHHKQNSQESWVRQRLQQTLMFLWKMKSRTSDVSWPFNVWDLRLDSQESRRSAPRGSGHRAPPPQGWFGFECSYQVAATEDEFSLEVSSHFITSEQPQFPYSHLIYLLSIDVWDWPVCGAVALC